jgi:hypothetical protein
MEIEHAIHGLQLDEGCLTDGHHRTDQGRYVLVIDQLASAAVGDANAEVNLLASPTKPV